MNKIPGEFVGVGRAENGCYSRNNKVYASRVGQVQHPTPDTFEIPNTITPQVGLQGLAQVTKITKKEVNIHIRSLQDCLVDLQATILHKDTVVQYEKHEIQNLYRPLDIVKVEIISLIPLLCSTIGNGLGVVTHK